MQGASEWAHVSWSQRNMHLIYTTNSAIHIIIQVRGIRLHYGDKPGNAVSRLYPSRNTTLAFGLAGSRVMFAIGTKVISLAVNSCRNGGKQLKLID